MPIANYTTDVAVEKTMGEVVGALQRRGVTRISTMYKDDGSPEGIAFTLKLPYGVFDFELPVRTDGVLRALQASADSGEMARLGVRPGVLKTYLTREHAAKVAWRIAAEWLRAQSALIDAELVTMEEVMLPYMIANGRGQTTYELFLANQKEITA